MPQKFYAYTILACSLLLLNSTALATTTLKCAPNTMNNRSARINLNQSSDGKLRANLIFGTTVSGIMYNVREANRGVFQGHIKGNEKFWIRLAISDIESENRYIRGHKAKLEVVYPTVLKRPGFDAFRSTNEDKFVCGEQIRSYRD